MKLLLASSLLFFAASSFASSTDIPSDVCFSARIRVAQQGQGDIILEDTPVAHSMDEASQQGLQLCQKLYPAGDCTVAGHLIVDCD